MGEVHGAKGGTRGCECQATKGGSRLAQKKNPSQDSQAGATWVAETGTPQWRLGTVGSADDAPNFCPGNIRANRPAHHGARKLRSERQKPESNGDGSFKHGLRVKT